MTRTVRVRYSLATAVAFLTFLIYLPALQNEFVGWDDNDYVFENPYIRSIDFTFFRWAFFHFYAANWHPLTWISHALDYALWGLNPLGHHLTNNTLHAVNTFLVVLLVVKLLEANRKLIDDRISPNCSSEKGGTLLTSPMQKRDGEGPSDRRTLIAAATTGLLFGLHPLHVESVAWVVERKDLLCGLFFLLSIMMYVRYVTQAVSPLSQGRGEEGGSPSSTITPLAPSYLKRGGRSRGSYLLSLGFFMLALLSKPMAVSLPLVLFILDWYPFGRITSLKTFRSAFIEKLPFLALSLISSILTVLAQKEAIVPVEFIPLSTRAVVAAKSLLAYIGKMLAPFNLMPLYTYPRDVSLLSAEYLLPIVLTAGITLACIIAAKKRRLWISAWGYYVVTLIPVLGIVQVGSQSMADRYTYLPSLGPFLVIGLVAAWGYSKANTLKRWRQGIRLFSAVMAVAVLACMAYLTSEQIRVWENGVSLWSCIIEHEPMRAPFAYYNRGVAFDRTGNYDKAIEDYDKAILLNPSYSEAYNNRGADLEKMDQLARAIENYGLAVAANPSYYRAYYNRGLAFERTGNYDKAIEDYDKAILLKPSYSEAYNNRGIVFDKMGRYNEAMEDYEKTIALNPSHYEAYYNLGIVYGKTALFDKAVESLNRAIAINPNYPYAYGARGLAYSQLGQYRSALDDLNKALALDNSYAGAYTYRGELYLKTGNSRLAVSDFQKACSLGDAEGCGKVQTVRP